jgi:hypothetical protein
MDVYLIKKNGTVVQHTDLVAMKAIENVNNPDRTVTVQEWEVAGGVAYIDGSGNIQLGIPPAEKARQDEIGSLQAEEKSLMRELADKDYKVIKCAEQGLVLAEQDPALHNRRDGCRARINEIRDRLAVLEGQHIIP